MNILGDYARKIPARILMNNKNDGHPTEIAQLWGARLAVGSEVEQSSFWSESKLNELTGDQTIAGRFMGCDWFNFPKSWKFLIYGNHRPRLNSITPAVKARIKMVPFNANFSEGGDPDLPSKLRREYPNILKWLVDGHLMWLDAGKKLPPCAAIDAEMDDYMESQATIENWMDQRLLTPSDPKFNPDTWCNATQLYADYKSRKEQRGEQPSSQVVWGENMKKHFIAKRGNGGMRYQTAVLERTYPDEMTPISIKSQTGIPPLDPYQRRRPSD
jgi:P4 family phage/plasmid primase-like protien